MSAFGWCAGLAALACSAVLAAGTPGSVVPALSLAAAVTAAPGENTQQACAQPGSYLTAIRTGEHSGYDRVVFQFAGKVPVATVERVDAIYNDPRGYRIPVAGQAYLRVTFDQASAVCQRPPHRTYTGPAALMSGYPQLVMVSAAGDFAGVLAFGLGLGASGGYRVFTLTSPSRLVIDVSHVALPRFPGIWPVTSWRAYWAAQYSWLTGHQPWLSDPAGVVQAWAASRYGAAPAVRTVSPGIVRFTRPDGTTVTVTGTRPVAAPGPWVITRIAFAGSTAARPPRCGPWSLAAGLHGFQAGLGNRGYILTLTNTGSLSCSLDGYPGLGLEDARHHTLASRTFRGSTYFDPDQGPHLIVLSPGETVSSDVAYAAPGAAVVPAAAYLEVTPPGAHQHLTVPIPGAPVVISDGSLYVTALARHTPY